MIFKPEWLKTPDYIVEEIQRCRDAVEPGVFETGLIVDATNTMYRLAFAASKDVSDASGMLAVFVERVQRVAQEIGADLVVCCIDYGVSLRRSMLAATKKPDKTPEDEAVVALGRAALGMLRGEHQVLEASIYPEKVCGVLTARPRPPSRAWLNPVWLDGYEADDLCAAFAFSGLCIHTVLYSTDSDLYQATDGSGVVQMSPANGKFLKSDVKPQQVAAVKALAGDSSDNVRGIKGVGPVTALKVLSGDTTIDLGSEDTQRIRNNITLTALPFPGSFQSLGAALKRVPNFRLDGPQTTEEDSEQVPF